MAAFTTSRTVFMRLVVVCGGRAQKRVQCLPGNRARRPPEAALRHKTTPTYSCSASLLQLGHDVALVGAHGEARSGHLGVCVRLVCSWNRL